MSVTAALPMLAKLKPNPNWAKLPIFDRKDWRTMAFGEFAESINERVAGRPPAQAFRQPRIHGPWRAA